MRLGFEFPARVELCNSIRIDWEEPIESRDRRPTSNNESQHGVEFAADRN